jgi:hypothetical protein
MTNIVSSVAIFFAMTFIVVVEGSKALELLGTLQPPIVSIPGDYVEPQKVKAGDTIKIHRYFEVRRLEPVTVIRTMVKGDCSARCVKVNLESGPVILTRTGIYSDGARDHIIPNHIEAGKWTLVFSIRWQGRSGRYIDEPMTPLEIEVVE